MFIEKRPYEDTTRRQPSASQEERPQKKLNLLILWFQTYSFQNYEWISVCYFKPSSLQYSVVASIKTNTEGRKANRKVKTKEMLRYNSKKLSREYVYKEWWNIKEEIREYINLWKEILCSWNGRLSMIKRPFLPNLIYRFNTIPIKIPRDREKVPHWMSFKSSVEMKICLILSGLLFLNSHFVI